MIDTHAHIDFDVFNDDRQDILTEAKRCHVDYIMSIGTDTETSRRAILMSEEFEGVYAAVGIHPTDVTPCSTPCFEGIEELLAHEKVKAVGEIGLDYYHDVTSPSLQKKWCDYFFDVAQEYDYPVVIHNRDAHDDLLDLLKPRTFRENPGVLHCFTGDIAFARDVLDLGFYVSFAGPLTYPKSDILREVAAYVPSDRIVIETDSPFLPPQSYRGKRNQPAYVRFVAEKLADVRQITIDEVDMLTSENARRLFDLPK